MLRTAFRLRVRERCTDYLVHEVHNSLQEVDIVSIALLNAIYEGISS